MQKLKKIEDVLLFLTLLFLPTQLGRHFWPEFSFIYSLKIDYLSPTFYFWDILVIVMLGVWILQKPKINFVALNLILFFLLTQIPSILNAVNTGASLVRLEQYLLTAAFGIYLASADLQILQRKINLPLVLGILGQSVLAISQFLKGGTLGFWVFGERSFTISTPAIAKFDFYGRQFLRPYATFSHPNVLSAYLLIGIWFIFKNSFKKLNLLAALLGSAVIFLAMSRTVILALLISAAILVKKKWLILMTVILLILSPILYTRFSAVFNFDNLTWIRREELSISSLKMFSHSPVFGIGLNNFIPAIATDLITGPNRFLQPVHNIFLLELAETGIIGLVGFLLLIGYPIAKMSNLSNFLPWLIIIFLGMFDHYFLTLPQGLRLFFLVWGLSLACANGKIKR